MAQPFDLTLYDLPQFRGLKAVGDAFGVRMRLTGGTASRLAMHLMHNSLSKQGLVELCPFSSDIDLEHDGDDALTPKIHEAIQALVPEAIWCRWSIAGNGERRRLEKRRALSAEIPLRNIVFDSWRAAPVDDRALQDMQALAVRCIARPGFADSAARREETDLEIFSLLLAIEAALDLAVISHRNVGVIGDEGFIERFLQSDDRAALARSWPLKRRLYYLTAALRARMPDQGALDAFFSGFQGFADVAPAFNERRALIVSAALADGKFRASPIIDLDFNADPRFVDTSREKVPDPFEIDPVFDTAGMTLPVPLAAGHAPSSGFGMNGARREFLHLIWRRTGPRSHVYTALCVDQAGRPYATTAVGGDLPNGAHWLRIDIGPVLERAPGQAIRVAFLQAHTIEESDPEWFNEPILGGGPDEALNVVQGQAPSDLEQTLAALAALEGPTELEAYRHRYYAAEEDEPVQPGVLLLGEG
ncbi:hypothetical protein ASD21_15945 [Caulobacter sp. Root1455]|uniref:hypothetical protein n=1 Tax=Caulobacter sp. Root1455 TaxID=1736465 RepID=UPI0006F366E6|nr:hypothetical protein [Caulobacter sp. Root1455]KQY91801.1 hypothetical protein ASD21_15945 [Caulobacter sp. Root1455]